MTMIQMIQLLSLIKKYLHFDKKYGIIKNIVKN